MTHRSSARSRLFGLLPRTAGAAAIAAAFASGAVTSGSLAAAEEPTADELLDQIQKLQQQVEGLKAAEKTAATEAAPTESESDAVARVLSDAEQRSSKSVLLQGNAGEPFIAGHDSGRFVLRSPDGNFELNPYFEFQARHVVNIASEDGDSFEDTDFGWEMRRVKVGFRGHAFSPDLTYNFRFAFNREGQSVITGVNPDGSIVTSEIGGGGTVLDNAFIEYTPDELFGVDNLGFRLGQFKDATFHEETTSAGRQIAVERSLVNQMIGGGQIKFVQGIGPLFSGEKWKAGLFYTDGVDSWNSDFQDDGDGDTEYGLAGRLDVVVLGDSDRPFRDFSALGTEEDTARIGGGFHYTGSGNTRVLYHSVDAQYETDTGMGLFVAYYGRWAEGDVVESFDVGGLAQVSQTLGDSGWEIFGRYDFILFENDLSRGGDTEDLFHELTAGVNKYWKSHNVKMTIDAVYLPNGNPGSNTGLGLRNSGDFEDQIAIRGQFQLLL